jgi:hypothetical protein
MKSLLVLLVLFAALVAVDASSHAEAPGVLNSPETDATDLYAFRSYEPGRESFVTILANYNPLQDPIAGPNYFQFSNKHFYEILVDNNGDGKPEWIFTFDTAEELNGPVGLRVPVGPNRKLTTVPLKAIGQITTGDNSQTQNFIEGFRLSVTQKQGRTGQVIERFTRRQIFPIPYDNVGQKTVPNYPSYAAQFVYDVDIPFCSTDPASTFDGSRVFVGQRQESFFIALGGTFDLVNYQSNSLPIIGVLTDSRANNDIGRFNIDTFALEIPISCLVGPNPNQPTIGVWTRTRSKKTGKQNQRLGNPLVNELIIGIDDKDKWNKVTPVSDELFNDYFNYPSFPELLDILFAAAAGAPRIAPNNFPRRDLIVSLEQGLPGLNYLTAGYNVYADMLRLNTQIPPTARGAQSNLGALGGDLAGFPNGRRLGDDVVDIVLRVAMGALCTTPFGPAALNCTAADAPTGTLAFGDGATADSTDFLGAFPYMNLPLPGAIL